MAVRAEVFRSTQNRLRVNRRESNVHRPSIPVPSLFKMALMPLNGEQLAKEATHQDGGHG